MQFEPALEPGTLVRRYKRFLADVVIEGAGVVTMHCPNTGAMTGCAEPDSRVWYSTSRNPRRKYAHTLELVETPDAHRIGVNSAFANALVDEALRDGVIPELAGYAWTREAPVPDGDGRFDFRLSRAGAPPCWVEVKSVTLHVGGGLGLFPDAVSDRAVRHVNALARRSASGDRAVLLFCVQHTAIERVDCAREIHPGYAEAVAAARAAGVEVLVYEVDVAPERMALGRRLPFLSNGGP